MLVFGWTIHYEYGDGRIVNPTYTCWGSDDFAKGLADVYAKRTISSLMELRF